MIWTHTSPYMGSMSFWLTRNMDRSLFGAARPYSIGMIMVSSAGVPDMPGKSHGSQAESPPVPTSGASQDSSAFRLFPSIGCPALGSLYWVCMRDPILLGPCQVPLVLETSSCPSVWWVFLIWSEISGRIPYGSSKA